MAEPVRVGPYGPSNAKIFFVGEAPGENEVKAGRPFVGKAGELLRKFCLEVGIDPDSCYYTNVCQVRPPGNAMHTFFTDGVPNNYVVEGLLALHKQIEQVKPNIVVALGNYALWALTEKAKWAPAKNDKPAGYRGITNWRGSLLAYKNAEHQKVLPTFHPSYILREGFSDHVTFKTDLQRALTESQYPEARIPQKRIVIDPQGADRYAARDYLLADPSKTLTFDIEYIGSRLLCIGMTTSRDEAFVFVTKKLNDIQFCKSILQSGIGLNAQNSMYDCGVLEWHYQFDLMHRMTFDTMLCQHAAAIEQPKALDFLSSIWCEWHYQWKDMVSWPRIKSGKQSIDDVWQYNAIDTWRQHEIMEEQIKWELCDPDIREVFEFEMALLNPLWQMSKRGVLVDRDKMEAIRHDCLIKQVEGSLYLMERFGREINVGSRVQLAPVLFGELGLKPVRLTKTGPSTDDKTLAELILKTKDEETLKILRTIRQVRVCRSLISKFVDVEIGADGRMRGLYNPAKTTTGRLASAKFAPTDEGANQQNFPRDKRVRGCFVPDVGKTFGYADLERAESLVVSYITGDPEMLAAHAPGIDAHRRLASRLFSKPETDITDDERYLGKKTRHAGNYMQGAERFMKEVNKEADKTGVSIEFAEAKHFITVYRRMHTLLEPWWRNVEATLWKTRTLRNLLGRKRVFQGHIGASVPNAVAFVPQSTVGDVLNVGLLGLSGIRSRYAERVGIHADCREQAAALRDCGFELLLQVHDAVGFQYNEGCDDTVLPILRDLMLVPLTAPSREVFTIPVEVAVGRSWGEVKVWHENKLSAA